MAIEAKTVVRVETGQSVDNLKALREQAKQYRQDMEGAEIGSEKFTEAQRKLSEVSDQVKNVLMLGTKEIDDTNKSYDSLVRTMSQLTKAWRATGDEAERARLGEQILEINTQLKNLDASRGNFQRNVGNYSSAFDGLSTSMSQVVRELPSLQMGLNTFVLAISNNLPILADNIARVKAEVADLNAKGDKSVSTIGAIAKSFFSFNTYLTLGIVAIQAIVSNWDKISAMWGDDSPQRKAQKAVEDLAEAINKINSYTDEVSIEITQAYTEALLKVGGSAEKAKEAMREYNEALRDNKLATAEAKLKAAEEAERLAYESYIQATTGRFAWAKDSEKELEALRKAQEEVRKFRAEIAQAENDIVKAQVDADVERAEKIKAKRDEDAKVYADYWVKIFEEEEARIQEEIDLFVPKMAEWVSGIYEANLTEFYKYVNKLSSAAMPDFDAIGDEIDKEIQANIKTTANALKEIEAREKASKEARLAGATELAGAMASLWEENTTGYKAFAIAQAIMDTYASAVASMKNMGGMPWGAIGVAASLATGFAQVKNIMSVDTSGKSTPNINGDVGAVVSAPAVVQEVPITRTITDTSVEDRLNAKLADQRVILVYSDVEEFGKQVQVQRAESSF